MTDAERKFWAMLRSAVPEWRFRRQVPFRQYIADFASHRARLVIEVDGGQHDQAGDAPRTAIIEADGYRIVRVWTSEVLTNMAGIRSQARRAGTGCLRMCRYRSSPCD